MGVADADVQAELLKVSEALFSYRFTLNNTGNSDQYLKLGVTPKIRGLPPILGVRTPKIGGPFFAKC